MVRQLNSLKGTLDTGEWEKTKLFRVISNLETIMP